MSINVTDHDNGIRILTIDRPPVNALNEETVQALLDNVVESASDPHIRAIIITGEGKFFVAGADVDKLLEADSGKACDIVRGVKALHQKMRSAPQPVIAAINGLAAGGGLELAMACDIRIAAQSAGMGLPEVTLGVLPGAGGTQMLPRLIGMGKAMELMFTGRIISASQALALRVIDDIASTQSALEKAVDLATAMIKNAPLSIAQIKAAAWDTLSLSLEQGLEMETKRFSQLCDSQDKNEGINAFKERRKAQFQGR